MQNYTRDEWGRCEITLETSGKDVSKMHQSNIKLPLITLRRSTQLVKTETTLGTSGEDGKLHSERVEKMENYTRNEWRKWKITLGTSGEDKKISLETSGEDKKISLETSGEDKKISLGTSGEDAKFHSERVEKMENYTRNEWRRWKITLGTSGEDSKLHSKRVGKMQNYTRNEWRRSR